MTRGKYWFVYHLIASWILYNVALAVALYKEIGEFNRSSISILLAMAVFGVGLAAYQWDIWKLHGSDKAVVDSSGTKKRGY